MVVKDILTDGGKIIFATSVIVLLFQELKIRPILVFIGFLISIIVYVLYPIQPPHRIRKIGMQP